MKKEDSKKPDITEEQMNEEIEKEREEKKKISEAGDELEETEPGIIEKTLHDTVGYGATKIKNLKDDIFGDLITGL